MSSNYPPGVDDNTYGAPWNTGTFSAVITLTMPFSYNGPVSKNELEEIKNDLIENLTNFFENTIEITEYEIEDMNIEIIED